MLTRHTLSGPCGTLTPGRRDRPPRGATITNLAEHLASFKTKAALIAHLKEEHPEIGRYADGTESLAHYRGNHLWAHDRSAMEGTPGPRRLADLFRVDL
ncbi:MAG: hypothetical protein ACOYOQ_00390 [Microthrixaceae bacterium]